jgi:hypothetical protein
MANFRVWKERNGYKSAIYIKATSHRESLLFYMSTWGKTIAIIMTEVWQEDKNEIYRHITRTDKQGKVTSIESTKV